MYCLVLGRGVLVPVFRCLRCDKLWAVFLGVGISDGLSLLPSQCVMHLGVIFLFWVSKINLWGLFLCVGVASAGCFAVF